MWPATANDDSPQSGGVPSTRAPKQRHSERPRSNGAGRSMPTTFFFRTEAELDDDATSSPTAASAESSTYGVQSLASTVSSTHEDSEPTDLETQTKEMNKEQMGDHSVHESSPGSEPTSVAQKEPSPERSTSTSSSESSPSRPLPRDVSSLALSGRLTPLHLYSPIGGTESGPASTPKSISIRSLQLSDDGSGVDDAASQAITSGDEEEEDGQVIPGQDCQEAPQLVMPNLRMPSRRPFTQRGKDIGKLKVLVAGAKGIGKTSLIRSIVQTCEDIVHVDPLTSSILSVRSSDRWPSRQPESISTSTENITEISASTRAYPSWWAELGESRVLRRRQSIGEQVLERNVCFVDTPGFDPINPLRQHIDAIVEHIEASLRRNSSFASLGEGEILSILSGNGGIQVDLVLYMFAKEPTAYDIDLMRRLSDLTPVVPVIAKADLYSTEELTQLSTSIATEMHSAEIPMLDLENPVPGTGSTSRHTWNISSANGDDDENMDASLLMSPDYIQPLVPSDLSDLVSHIFDPEKAAWLRHMAVKKFLHWRRSQPDLLSTMTTLGPLQTPSPANPMPFARSPTSSALSLPSDSQVLMSKPPSLQLTTALHHQPNFFAPSISPSPYAAARFADHTQREEMLTQVRLARWASDLQRSLQNERQRFEALQQDEKRGWLIERWGELEQDENRSLDGDNNSPSSPIPAANDALKRTDSFKPKQTTSGQKQLRRSGKGANMIDPTDPLGLLEWDDRIRRNGLVVVKVLGGCGVLGAMVVWALKHWGIVSADYSLFLLSSGHGASGAGSQVLFPGSSE